MFEQQPTLELFLEQVGLDASESAWDPVIIVHHLSADVELHDAEFWSEGQRQFLQSHIDKDDDWAIVIDELNQQLHIDSNPKA